MVNKQINALFPPKPSVKFTDEHTFPQKICPRNIAALRKFFFSASLYPQKICSLINFCFSANSPQKNMVFSLINLQWFLFLVYFFTKFRKRGVILNRMSLRGENRQIEKRHRPNNIAKSHSCQKIHEGFVIIYSYLILRKYTPSPCVAHQVNLHFTVSDSKTVWDYVPSVKNIYTTWRCFKVKTFTQKHFISLNPLRNEFDILHDQLTCATEWQCVCTKS